ncbi:phenylacetate-CoA ligase [Frankia sp. Hr75.2]|nr:phenylacetate-CoA ligase [Frankia sp. Hr75.2]
MNGAGSSALADILAFAATTVPYYHDRLTARGVFPEVAEQVLFDLPILDREEVRRHRVRLRSEAGESSGWRTVRTTGTSGIPVEITIDQEAQQAEMDALTRQITAVLDPAEWLDDGLVHLTLHLASTTRSQRSPWSIHGTMTKWSFNRVWHLPPDLLGRSLHHLDRRVVTGMPSVLTLVAERARDVGAIRPHALVLSGETVQMATRRRLGEIFDCPVTSLYTLAEFGVVGNGCLTTDDYHVNERDVVVEILEPRLTVEPAAGRGGEILVTGLVNRAMPLLRYRTGDRGVWSAGSCGCPVPGRRFSITTARSLHVVADGANGRRITELDLCKLFTQLDVQGARIVQTTPTDVVVAYEADRPLPSDVREMAEMSVRQLVGPGITVSVARVTESAVSGAAPVPTGAGRMAGGATPPRQTEADEVVGWARPRLARVPGLLAAVLTGSILDPVARSRFSDIDMHLLVDDARPELWLDLTRELHAELPGLRVNVTDGATLAASPLVLSRLLAERQPVVGDLSEHGLRQPEAAALRAEATFWAQDAQAVLWTQVSSVGTDRDPLRDAWLAGRYMLDAFRYHFLIRGRRETAASQVAAASEADRLPYYRLLFEVMEVSREHRPPPPAESDECRGYLLGALSCIRWFTQSLRGDAVPGPADRQEGSPPS